LAEKITTPPGTAMDYAEHERTYERFVELTTVSAIHVATLLLALVMFGFGDNVGFWLGFLTIVLAVVAAAFSIARKSVKPAAVVLGIAAILALLSVA
jgi:hypothetical protein